MTTEQREIIKMLQSDEFKFMADTGLIEYLPESDNSILLVCGKQVITTQISEADLDA